MRKTVLVRTNLFICATLLLGFVAVTLVSYRINTGTFKKDIERIAVLTSESIFYQIDAFFSKPVNVSLTMANDSLLKRVLREENAHAADGAYVKQIQSYLNAYRVQYGYDSVFLISTVSGRYYHFNGLNRVLTPESEENVWYYDFLKGKEDYSLNVDNDEAAGDVITVFVNCKIKDDDGGTIGVVGVGLRVENLQELLQSYSRQYNIEAVLLDGSGIIEISSGKTGLNRSNLFDTSRYAGIGAQVLADRGERQKFWNKDQESERFIAAQYVPTLKWYLVVENDTELIRRQFRSQVLWGLVITALIIALLLVVVNRIILNYNTRLVKQTMSQELEYQNLLREATQGMYDNIFELDITRNRAGAEGTRRFFEALGMSGDTPYHLALEVIAAKQIKKEFAQGYIATFSPENVLAAYEKGISELYYDFMTTDDGEHYRWIRLRARIFYWKSDQSVRMITYRRDITAEKEHEKEMRRIAQCDPLTEIYNRKATKERISAILEGTDPSHTHALLMIDIDYFKHVNDTYGHAAGDSAIREFAARLRTLSRKTDICGRIGGDEFMMFLRDIPGRDWLEMKVGRLIEHLRESIPFEGGVCLLSASIGVSVYPEAGTDFDGLYHAADSALYESKERGRDCYTIYSSSGRGQGEADA